MRTLIEKLRMVNPSVFTLYKARAEAADEIERLRKQRDRLLVENQRLRKRLSDE